MRGCEPHQAALFVRFPDDQSLTLLQSSFKVRTHHHAARIQVWSLILDWDAPSVSGKRAEVSRCISQGAETPHPIACCWPNQTCSYVEKVIHVDRCRTSWYSSTSRYSISEREEASQALARADGLGLWAANMDGSGALGLRHYFRMHRLLLRSIQPTPRYSHMC